KIAGWLVTFLCVLIGWTFFRAESFASAKQILSAMFVEFDKLVLPLSYAPRLELVQPILSAIGIQFGDVPQKSLAPMSVAVPALLAAILLPNSLQWMAHWHVALERVAAPDGVWRRLAWEPTVWFAVLTSILLILINGVLWSETGGTHQFIYFQF